MTRVERLEEEARIRDFYAKTIEYSRSDVRACLWQARVTAEAICQQIFVEKIDPDPGSLRLDNLIGRLRQGKHLPDYIAVPLRSIQGYGNYGAHAQRGEGATIPAALTGPCLKALEIVIRWYFDEISVPAEAHPESGLHLAAGSPLPHKRAIEQQDQSSLPTRGLTVSSRGARNQGPSNGRDLRVESLSGVLAEAGPRTPSHNLPLPPDPDFVGRAALLDEVHAQLRPSTPVALAQPPRGLSGLGGIGKTALALEYAHRHLSSYDLVVWVDAEGADVTRRVAEAGRTLGLGSSGDSDRAMATQLRKRLERGGPHLLILDNVENSSSIRHHLPRVGSTRVLLTTRIHSLRGTTSIEVGFLPPDEAVMLLLGGMEMADYWRPAALRICESLGFLTIGLAIAGALLAEGAMSPQHLLDELTEVGPLAWSERFSDDLWSAKDTSLERLFDSSFGRLNEDRPEDFIARAMLCLGGWFAPIPIPRGLLGIAAVQLCSSWLARNGDTAEAAISKLGLVELVAVYEERSLEHQRLTERLETLLANESAEARERRKTEVPREVPRAKQLLREHVIGNEIAKAEQELHEFRVGTEALMGFVGFFEGGADNSHAIPSPPVAAESTLEHLYARAARRLVQLGLAQSSDRESLSFHRLVRDYARLQGGREAGRVAIVAAMAEHTVLTAGTFHDVAVRDHPPRFEVIERRELENDDPWIFWVSQLGNEYLLLDLE